MTARMTRRHLPFLLAFAAGVVAFVASRAAGWEAATVISACLFFLLYLGITFVRIPRFDARYLKEHAASADEPAPIIFLLTFGTILVSLGCLFAILNQQPASRDPVQVGLALLTVALGWFTIHTMAALHYAHLYWQGDSKSGKERKPRGGLAFPGTESPEGWDFLYYSMVIGMTAQTADTNITQTRMRRVTTLHSVFSFFFNTVIVAAAVNLVVSIGSN